MLKCLSGKTDCTPIKKELIGLAAKFEEFCKNFLSKKDEVGLQKLYDQLLRNNVEVWEKAEEHKKFFSMGDQKRLYATALDMFNINSKRIKIKNKIRDLLSYPFKKVKTY